MPSLRTFTLAALLTCLVPLTVARAVQPAIQTQMSPEEFKGAGLDKLTAQELARLNAWLGRTIDTQSAKAATEAQALGESRGLFDSPRQQPIAARIPGPFNGFAKGRSYTLDNGQVWQQIDDAQLPGIRLTDPAVRIKPALLGNTWYMQVGKYNSRAQVRRIK